MAPAHSPHVDNRLLASLLPADLGLLRPHLEPIPLRLRDVLIEANQPIGHVYFPQSGMGSVIHDTAEGRVEVGVIGREGLCGLPVLLGADQAPHEHMVQGEGEALRISSEALRSAMGQSPSLQALLLLYGQTFLVQVAQTAFVNATHGIEVRLARWLLMTQDRMESNELQLTHDFLSMMLGVRRAGVTVALHVLEGNGLIRATRGLVTVRDRERLIELADGTYGPPEAEYARLMGQRPIGQRSLAQA